MKSLVELFKARGFLGQSPEPLVATSGTPKRSASAGESEFCELASKRERTLAGGPLFFVVYCLFFGDRATSKEAASRLYLFSLAL